LSMNEVSTYNSEKEAKAKAEATAKAEAAKAKVAAAKAKAPVVKAVAKAPTYEEVKPLLAKFTCNACHNPDKKQVGPAFRDIAKRNYTNEMMVKLIYNPNPENWPGYATEMPPM